MFRARCARCHGLEGGGGEGPALARPYLNYARDDLTLVTVIQNGIPGTGMPAGGWLSDLEARQIAAYVRTLGRVPVVAPVTGNAVRGEALFRDKGACASCHGLNAVGTEFGPELLTIGARRSAEFIRQSIMDPDAELPRGLSGVMGTTFRNYLPVTARIRPGDEVLGYRVNESNFVILVRDEGGVLHSFDKTKLAELTKHFGRSLMPSYRDELTTEEVDDLVAYLVGLREVVP